MNDIQTFIQTLEEKVAPLERNLCRLHWELATTGKDEVAQQASEAEKEYKILFSNPEDYKKLKNTYASGIKDPLTKRVVENLIKSYLPNQLDEATISDLVERQTEIENMFNNFRATLDGEKITDNDLKEKLKTEKNSVRRKEIWEATKQIGPLVAEKVKELAKRRNKAAQSLGFTNHFAMSFHLQELNPNEIFSVFAGLKRATDSSFTREIQRLHKKLGDHYGIRPEEVRSWHYEDPFAQMPPSLATIDLDPYFKDRDLVTMTRDFYKSIDLDISDVLEQSDLFEREGKSQHAFCIHMNRGSDIRVLTNIRPNTYWASTMLHEYGHAAYSKNIDPKLPYFLREECHIMTTEAMAMMTERMIFNPHWWKDFMNISIIEDLTSTLALEKMIMARWVMVVSNFEQELYRNPDQDLNGLWWKLVKTYQLIETPEGRNTPDWAAKIHISTSPAYYQNYLLGELCAAQIVETLEQEAMKKSLKETSFYKHPAIGKLLRERVFGPGGSVSWKQLIPNATGKTLGFESFARQFCH